MATNITSGFWRSAPSGGSNPVNKCLKKGKKVPGCSSAPGNIPKDVSGNSGQTAGQFEGTSRTDDGVSNLPRELRVNFRTCSTRLHTYGADRCDAWTRVFQKDGCVYLKESDNSIEEISKRKTKRTFSVSSGETFRLRSLACRERA